MKLIIFTPNLAHFYQNILNIWFIRKWVQNVYFFKIYSLSTLVLVWFDIWEILYNNSGAPNLRPVVYLCLLLCKLGCEFLSFRLLFWIFLNKKLKIIVFSEYFLIFPDRKSGLFLVQWNCQKNLWQTIKNYVFLSIFF